MTQYDWILGQPVQTDNTNYEWVLGAPYIVVEVAAAGNIKTIAGVSWANVKKVSGVAKASIKKIAGITAS